MKILILSKDKNIFSPTSVAYQNILHYSEQLDQVHVIVFTKKKDKLVFSKVSNKLFIYPTNSRFNWLFLRDVLKIVKSQILWKSTLIANLICAENSLQASVSAYFISKKYKKNYIIEILDNDFSSGFSIKTKIFNHIIARASAIRVASQAQGEIMSAKNPALEKRTFILPLVDLQKNTNVAMVKTVNTEDIHNKFTQFNVILLAVNQLIKSSDLRKLRTIMETLRLRYPRVGLVIVAKIKHRIWHPFLISSIKKYAVIEKRTPETTSYYQHANVFVDISSDGSGSEELIRAVYAGCPTIASNTPANMNIIRDGENGFISDPRKPKLFARKIMDILEKPGLREMMRVYRYNITDIYGANLDDYYRRLIMIWETCKTADPDQVSPITQAQTKKVDFYPALRLDTAKKVFQIVEKNKQTVRYEAPSSGQNEIFDVDSIKLGIKKALQELELDGEFETTEKEELESI